MKLKDLLEYLDGRGLILTDDDLINEALKDMGVSIFTDIPQKDYKEFMENQLIIYFNDYLEEHNSYQEEEDEQPPITKFSEVDLNLEGFRERFKGDIEIYESLK